jgi:hypothetical protein
LHHSFIGRAIASCSKHRGRDHGEIRPRPGIYADARRLRDKRILVTPFDPGISLGLWLNCLAGATRSSHRPPPPEGTGPFPRIHGWAEPSSLLRFASFPISIRATLPTPPSARAHMTRASAIATSWAGKCHGILPRRRLTRC